MTSEEINYENKQKQNYDYSLACRKRIYIKTTMTSRHEKKQM